MVFRRCGRLLTSAAAMLLAAGIGAGAQSADRVSCESLVVPSYMSPGPGWNNMIASAPRNGAADRILILNPSSGPGAAAQPRFREVVQRAQQSGQKIYGYVPTGYGARSVRSVQQQVQRYIDWYGVNGIFFDEASDKAALASRYYQPLADFVTARIAHAGVMLNPGTFPSSAYARLRVPKGARLQLVVFEHDFGAFTSPQFVVPRWVHRHPVSMFVSMVYDANEEQLATVLRLSAQRGFGTVYVTDQTLPNPYGRLPGFWDALSRATQQGCGG